MEARAKLIDLAAFLDRIDRAEGQDDFRIKGFRRALAELQKTNPERAKRVLLSLSDPTAEPIAHATTQGRRRRVAGRLAVAGINLMRYIEPHGHMVSRTTDDYLAMVTSGCQAVCEPAFWAGFDRGSVEGFHDYFSQLTEHEPKRAAKFGLPPLHLALHQSRNPRFMKLADGGDRHHSASFLTDPMFWASGKSA